MAFLLIFLPFLGFSSGVFFGFAVESSLLTTLNILLSFFVSFSNMLDIVYIQFLSISKFFIWFITDNLIIFWCFTFDSLSLMMLSVITLISFLVHLYSTEYMENDPHFSRFMSYLSLFTLFMIFLVTGATVVQMFLGWEGVGLCSYLLINFWYTRIQANKSAIKAMLVNRVGDFALLISLFSIIVLFETLNYSILCNTSFQFINYKIVIENIEFIITDFICLLLFIGAMGKSAQLGLHIWLPDAMEGPTPVSALIHAATMVTAGIFLLSRCSFLFEHSPSIRYLIIIIGSLTAFFGSTVGLFQNDVKKTIAYSTCSQLGYMMFSCGLSNYDIGLFHLSNHAIFKALLFLSAGSIIHSVGEEQDMRKLGGLKSLLPIAYISVIIGSFALAGFPFLAGFYSKDTILEASYVKDAWVADFSYFLGTFSAFCTAFYSTRLLYLVFLSSSNSSKNVFKDVHEPSWRMQSPLIFLAFLSIFIGYVTKDLFIGLGTSFWQGSLFSFSNNNLIINNEFCFFGFKILPLIMALSGIFLCFFMYNANLKNFFFIKLNKTFIFLYTFLIKKWFFDKLSVILLTQSVFKTGYHFSYQKIDRGLIEQFGPTGIVNLFQLVSTFFLKFHTGLIHQNLFLTIFTTILLFISFFTSNCDDDNSDVISRLLAGEIVPFDELPWDYFDQYWADNCCADPKTWKGWCYFPGNDILQSLVKEPKSMTQYFLAHGKELFFFGSFSGICIVAAKAGVFVPLAEFVSWCIFKSLKFASLGLNYFSDYFFRSKKSDKIYKDQTGTEVPIDIDPIHGLKFVDGKLELGPGKLGGNPLKWYKKSNTTIMETLDDFLRITGMKCDLKGDTNLSLTNPKNCEVNSEGVSNLGDHGVDSPFREDYTPVSTPPVMWTDSSTYSHFFSMWDNFFIRNCKMNFNYDFLPGTELSYWYSVKGSILQYLPGPFPNQLLAPIQTFNGRFPLSHFFEKMAQRDFEPIVSHENFQRHMLKYNTSDGVINKTNAEVTYQCHHNPYLHPFNPIPTSLDPSTLLEFKSVGPAFKPDQIMPYFKNNVPQKPKFKLFDEAPQEWCFKMNPDINTLRRDGVQSSKRFITNESKCDSMIEEIDIEEFSQSFFENASFIDILLWFSISFLFLLWVLSHLLQTNKNFNVIMFRKNYKFMLYNILKTNEHKFIKTFQIKIKFLSKVVLIVLLMFLYI